MEIITIVSSTNRAESYTFSVASVYHQILLENGVESRLLSLTDLPDNFLKSDLYGQRSPEFKEIIDQYVSGVNKFVFVAPEYNGSYPGVLKSFIDGVPPRMFHTKKAGIIGVSSGAAGNLRGQEHLTGVLHYLKVFVHYNKLKLSGIDKAFDGNRHLVHEDYTIKLKDHAKDIISF
ncbi:MAG: NADPH-dependent FMN reductase [Flavobacteriales bacterium]|jgi:chromate reductase